FLRDVLLAIETMAKPAMKRVVITGASRGLGRALAEEFIRLGHTVLGCGRSAKSIAELRGRFDKPHDFDAVDVASDEKVKAWAKRLLKTPGPPDLLLNMAAIPLNPGIINTDMLQSCFGGSASAYPTAEEWAKKAVPFLLSLGPKHNGQPLTAP